MSAGARPYLKQVIGWEEFGILTERLVKKVQSDDSEVDLVVGIARGGIPLSMVLADRLRVPVDFINVKSYTAEGKRSEVRILSTLLEDANRKSVLLVDDLVDEGDTLEKMTDFLRQNYSIRNLKTAVLFVKPWSRFSPDFFVETTKAWIVFPWEHGEFLTPEL
ncbi:MAG: phosphoribosyltransferase family protein [Conexivisphaerales archaeon]